MENYLTEEQITALVDKRVSEMLATHLTTNHANLQTQQEIAELIEISHDNHTTGNNADLYTRSLADSEIDSRISKHLSNHHSDLLAGAVASEEAQSSSQQQKKSRAAAGEGGITRPTIHETSYGRVTGWAPPQGSDGAGNSIPLKALPAPEPGGYPDTLHFDSTKGYVLGTQADMLTWVSEDRADVVVGNRTDIVGGNWNTHANHELSIAAEYRTSWIKRDETKHIGGKRTVIVEGNNTVDYKGKWIHSVKGVNIYVGYGMRCYFLANLDVSIYGGFKWDYFGGNKLSRVDAISAEWVSGYKYSYMGAAEVKNGKDVIEKREDKALFCESFLVDATKGTGDIVLKDADWFGEISAQAGIRFFQKKGPGFLMEKDGISIAFDRATGIRLVRAGTTIGGSCITFSSEKETRVKGKTFKAGLGDLTVKLSAEQKEKMKEADTADPEEPKKSRAEWIGERMVAKIERRKLEPPTP